VELKDVTKIIHHTIVDVVVFGDLITEALIVKILHAAMQKNAKKVMHSTIVNIAKIGIRSIKVLLVQMHLKYKLLISYFILFFIF